MKRAAQSERAERARPGGSGRAEGARPRESGRPPRAKSEGSEPSEERGEHFEDGYILLGIVIGLVVLGIFMVAAVPLWQKAIQREKEAELIFRGYQYMQAIELYQKKFPGAYPPSIDVLVEQKFLRKAYTDPMTENGEWQILRQLSPELQPGAGAQQQAGAQAGITGLNRSQAQTRPAGGQFQSSLGRGPSDASMGGVVGVASRSTEKTFYQVPGKEKYKDWLFVWGAQPVGATPGLPGQPQPGQPGQPVRPGQPGQPGAPGPGVPSLGQGALGASPFPGLPPPPSLTSVGMGRTAMPAAVPGQPAQPGQMGNVPGTQPQPQQQQRPPD